MYLSFSIFLSNLVFFVSLSIVSELFCGKLLESFVILSVILLPVKSPVPSAVFLTALFEVVLTESVADCLP